MATRGGTSTDGRETATKSSSKAQRNPSISGTIFRTGNDIGMAGHSKDPFLEASHDAMVPFLMDFFGARKIAHCLKANHDGTMRYLVAIFWIRTHGHTHTHTHGRTETPQNLHCTIESSCQKNVFLTAFAAFNLFIP